MKILISEKGTVTKDLCAAMNWQISGGIGRGQFENEEIVVLPTYGHLKELKDISDLCPNLSWNDPSTLVPIPTDRTLVTKKPAKNGKGADPRALLKRIEDTYKKNNVSEIILATDSDREGEAIAWEVIEHIGYKGKMRRAWFAGGVDKKSLKDAMQNLRSVNVTKSWWRSSEARNWSDWNYIFLTIAYTYYAKFGKFGFALSQGKGASGVLSLGRVQTPTVGMIVTRELEIQNFIETDHYRINGLFDGDAQGRYHPEVTREIIESKPQGIQWTPSKKLAEEGKEAPLESPLFINEARVNSFISKLNESGDKAKVIDYKESEKTEQPPKVYDLPHAGDAVAKATGLSATVAQTLIEDIYEQGYISYARTSKSDVPSNYHLNPKRNEMIQACSQLEETKRQGDKVRSIHDGNDNEYKPFKPSMYADKDMEHHGIVPTSEVMTPEKFKNIAPKKGKGYTSDQMQKAYIVIAKRYLQALYPPAKYATQDITVELPVEDLLGNKRTIFKLTSKRVIDLGWRQAYQGAPQDSILPKLNIGDYLPLKSANKTSSRTKPPKRYSETGIMIAMADVGKKDPDPKIRKLLAMSEGIGTPATRKSIIETIIKRGYVKVVKGNFHATQKGIDLMNHIPDFLKSAQTTAIWEKQLLKISELKDDNKAIQLRDQFSDLQRKNVEALINQLRNSYDNNLGEKIANVPSKMTEKMTLAVKGIAKQLKIGIPNGALKDPAIAIEFINKNKDKLSTEPSASQIKWAKEIESSVTEAELTEEILKSKRLISEFITKYKDKGIRKPTDKMISLLNSLISKDKSDYKVDPEAYTDINKCSKAIDYLNKANIKPPTDAQKKFIDKISDVATAKQKPDESVYKDIKKAKSYINKYKNLLNVKRK